MTKSGKVILAREWTGPSCVLNDKPQFTVTELMRRYPDGNIPDMPGRAERRVRKLARKRLAAAGVIYKPHQEGAESV